MKTFKLLCFALLGATVLFTGCDNDDDEPQIDEGTVNMMFEYKVGEEGLDMSKIYDINGTAVQFSVANFYVGGITFKPEHGVEGDPVNVEGKYLLVKPESGGQEVTTLKTGHWHEVEFFIGVGQEENSQTTDDFTNRDADDPLAEQEDVPMHWSWNAGYIFIRFDGMVDTDGDSTPDTAMEFHLGTDQMRTELSYTIHKDIEAGNNMVHFQFDLEKAFEGIDLSTEYSTHTGDNLPLAQKLQANLADAIAPAHE